MRKFVIDTNALLQILGARSKYHFLWEKFIDEEFFLCVSTEVLLEYEEILKQKASPAVASLFSNKWLKPCTFSAATFSF